MYEIILQTGVIIVTFLGLVEWRFRAIQKCINRVDSRLDAHLENARHD